MLKGIIRGADSLGRLVLPKEMRRALGIVEGSPMEIILDGDRIILKKFVPEESIEDKLEAFESCFEGMSTYLPQDKVYEARKHIKGIRSLLREE